MSAAHHLTPVERRRTPRIDAWKRAIASLHGGRHLTCMIENLSDTGALLHFAAAGALPTTLALVVPDDRVRLACRVVWVDGRHAGVEFTAPPERFDHPAPASGAARR